MTPPEPPPVPVDRWPGTPAPAKPKLYAPHGARQTFRRIVGSWGAEDLIASMRGRTSRFPDGRYRDVASHARSAVLLAASAYGRPAIDSVYVNIPDLDGLAAEAEDAAASGFALKACIHPSQVPVVRAAFRADEEQIAWARRVLAAARDGGGRDGGAVKVGGQMIDAPLLRQAEAILSSLR